MGLLYGELVGVLGGCPAVASCELTHFDIILPSTCYMPGAFILDFALYPAGASATCRCFDLIPVHAELLAAGQGFHATADVALVAAPLSVLDADLSFEVRGPAKSAAEARKQQQKYAAAKEARRLLGEACLVCDQWGRVS